jgi:hypothetical protein
MAHMQRFVFSALLGISILTLSADSAFSQTKAKAKPKAKTAAKPAMTITEATSRTITYLSNKDHPHTDIRMKGVWNSSTPPKEIFYRADAAHWLKCRTTISKTRPFLGGNQMVVDENVRPESFQAGQLFNLKPEENPSEVQPDEVKKMPAGAIFYQLKGSTTWQYVKVKLKVMPEVKHP